MFVVFDEIGRITQTIVGPDIAYGDLLDQHNYTWLFLEGSTTLDVRSHYVDVGEKQVAPCQFMVLAIDKPQIKADGIDTVTIKGIPPGATAHLLCDDAVHLVEVVTDGEISFNTPTAATYGLAFECFKYLPANVEIIAS